MAERAEHLVDMTIAAATVDLEASAGERVRFVPEQLEAVATLRRDAQTRERVMEITRQRLDAAIMALDPATAEPGDWHDVQAALALLNHLESTGTYLLGDDGSLDLVPDPTLNQETT
jgi:hypothetical protein